MNQFSYTFGTSNIPLFGETIGEKLRNAINTYKIPKFWKFVDSFPMIVTGKIRKVEMREVSAKELGIEQFKQFKTSYSEELLILT